MVRLGIEMNRERKDSNPASVQGSWHLASVGYGRSDTVIEASNPVLF